MLTEPAFLLSAHCKALMTPPVGHPRQPCVRSRGVILMPSIKSSLPGLRCSHFPLYATKSQNPTSFIVSILTVTYEIPYWTCQVLTRHSAKLWHFHLQCNCMTLVLMARALPYPFHLGLMSTFPALLYLQLPTTWSAWLSEDDCLTSHPASV